MIFEAQPLLLWYWHLAWLSGASCLAGKEQGISLAKCDCDRFGVKNTLAPRCASKGAQRAGFVCVGRGGVYTRSSLLFSYIRNESAVSAAVSLLTAAAWEQGWTIILVDASCLLALAAVLRPSSHPLQDRVHEFIHWNYGLHHLRTYAFALPFLRGPCLAPGTQRPDITGGMLLLRTSASIFTAAGA